MAGPFKRILCPIDFDDNSLAALDYSAGLAQGSDATIYVLHVVRAPAEPSEVPVEPPIPEWKQDAQARLEDAARSHLDGKVHYQLIAKRGDPAPAIIETERELNPDVVVMATHGRTGLSHLLIGSVTEHVVRESPRPVLTVRAAHS
jgi:universal stress protein A